MIDLARDTLGRWIDVEGYRLAAALAFYALLSFVPLVVLGLAVLEVVLGDHAASRWEVLSWVDTTGSPALRSAVESALVGLRHPDSGAVGVVIGLGGALLGASGVFGELDTSLNRIFGSERPTRSLGDAIRTFVRDRLSAFGAVIVTSLIVLVATIVGAASTALQDAWFAPGSATQALSFAATTVLLGLALTACIRWVPNAKVRWRSAATGGLGAAFVLQVVRIPFGWAIVRFTDYPTYGVVGSVLVVLLWMWVAAGILLLGASAAATLDRRPVNRVDARPRAPTRRAHADETSLRAA